MQGFREILADLDRKARAGELLEHEPDPSHCGCILPDGCFGRQGWHFFRHTAASLRRKFGKEFVEALQKAEPSLRTDAARRRWLEWCEKQEELGRMDPVSGLHRDWRVYLGEMVAYEECSGYVARRSEGLNTETAARRAERGDRTYG
jgi:hypothetical protein